MRKFFIHFFILTTVNTFTIDKTDAHIIPLTICKSYQIQGYNIVKHKILPEKSILAPHLTLIKIPTDFDSIYKAIDYAISGDTIIIEEGTYSEALNILNKELIIASEFILDTDTTHINKTVLSGNDKFQIALIINTNETVKFVGLTFSHGWDDYKGGAVCNRSGNLNILSCRFDSNSVHNFDLDWGGAIYFSGNTLAISNSVFNNNYATADYTNQFSGGAIYVENADSFITNNSLFLSNSGSFGGAIGILNSEYSVLDSCIFDQNEGKTSGAAIHASSDLYIQNSIFKNNYNTYDSESIGDIVSAIGTKLSIDKSVFKANTATHLLHFKGDVRIINSMFTGNNCTAGFLTGSNNVSLNISNCLFAHNTSTRQIGFEGSFIRETSYLKNNIFYKNNDTTNVAGLQITNNVVFPVGQLEDIDSLIGDLIKINANSDSCDIYCNLFYNPYFQDTTDYLITDSSVCIDAGIFDSIYEDFSGNYRIFDGNNDGIPYPDIGPYEYASKKIDDPVIFISNQSGCQGDTVEIDVQYLNGDNYSWNGGLITGSVLKTDTTGSYWLNFMKDGCLFISNSFNVIIYTLPNISIDGSPYLYTDNELNLSVGSGYSNYLWNTGDTTSSIKLIGSDYEPDTLIFWCLITDDVYQCSKTDSVEIIVKEGSSNIEKLKELNVKVYPNPVTKFIRIESKSLIENIIVTDISGKVVLSENFRSFTIDLSMDDLNPGIYFLAVNAADNSIVKKLLLINQ